MNSGSQCDHWDSGWCYKKDTKYNKGCVGWRSCDYKKVLDVYYIDCLVKTEATKRVIASSLEEAVPLTTADPNVIAVHGGGKENPISFQYEHEEYT